MKKLILCIVLFSFAKNHAQQIAANALQSVSTTVGFTENKGQVTNQFSKENKNVLYLLNTSGLNVQLRKGGFSYDFYDLEKVSSTKKKISSHGEDSLTSTTFKSKIHRVDFDFIGVNPDVEILAEGKSESYRNYYTNLTVSSNFEKVYSYKKVRYKNIYKGIDLVFTVPENQSKPVEYNFIISEHGNIDDIRFRISGAKNEIKNNSIEYLLRFGAVQESIPMSWVESNEGNVSLDIKYKKIRKNTYGFSYNGSLKGKKAIIDPVPIRLWGTYFGGYANVVPMAITTDNANNVYVSGSTLSIENVATEGTFQSTYIEQNTSNGYISKLSPEGVQLWGTYYPVYATTMAADSNMNLVFSGQILQIHPNVTTPDSYMPVKNAGVHAYLVKLNSEGLRVWGTYFGGNDGTDSGKIVIDTDNNIYMAGETNCTQGLAMPGAAQPSFGGGLDGYLAKFSAGGLPQWCTYFGGSGADGANGLEISNDNYLYISGTCNSPGMGTPGSYKPDYNGTTEILLGKFDSNGTKIWSTYLGGEGYEYLLRSTISGNNLFLQGRSSSSTEIGTDGSFHPNYVSGPNGMDAYYVINFNTEDQDVTWGTYSKSQITGIAANQNGDLLFCGDTNENTGVTTADAYMPVKDLYSKSYLIKLGAAGERIWGTYYGGDKAEQICYVAVDTVGDIYMHGMTNGSMTGIATPNAHQETISPNNVGAAYIVKFRDCNSVSSVSSNSPVCPGFTINLQAQGGTNYLWTGPNNFSSIEQNPVITGVSSVQSGQYSCLITGTLGCDASQTVEVIVGDTTSPVAAANSLPEITAACSTTISVIPTAQDACDGTLSATTTDPLIYSVSGTYTVHWVYTDSSGNSTTQEQLVTITQEQDPLEYSVSLFNCLGDNSFNLNEAEALISAGPGAVFTYYSSESDALQQQNPIGNLSSYETDIDKELYIIVAFPGGCKSLIRLYLIFNGLPYIPPLKLEKCLGTGNQVFDLEDVLLQFNSSNEYTVSYYATENDLENSILINDIHNFATSFPLELVYIKAVNQNGCASVGTIELAAQSITELELPDYLECKKAGNAGLELSIFNGAVLGLLPEDNYTISYYNTYGDAVNSTVNTISSTVTVTSDIKTYYYSFTGASGGCPYIIKHRIGSIDSPEFEWESEYGICEGEELKLTLPDGYHLYKWSDKTTSQSATFDQPGEYSAAVTSSTNGILCETVKYFTIVVYDTPLISKVEISDFTATDNTITVLPYNGDYLYSIDGKTFHESNSFYGLKNGVYTITVKDKAGCGIATRQVVLLDYPKYFSPNSDGKTDFWHVKNAFLSNATISIYDRYGKMLKTLTQNDKGWDGTYDGAAMPATDYWFTVQRNDGPEFKAHFALIR